jgi:hypothetical protein
LEQRNREAEFLELGLLLIVTGLMVGVFMLSLAFVLARESTLVSSSSLALVIAAALSGLFAVVFVLIRRVKRLMGRDSVKSFAQLFGRASSRLPDSIQLLIGILPLVLELVA